MKKNIIKIVLLLVLLTGCRQQKEREPEKVIVVKTDTLALSISVWTDHYKKFSFKTDSFTFVQKDTFPEFVRELNGFDALEKEKKDLLKYSPDGKQVLDMYSYNLILEENELGEMVFGENADTEVLLLEPEKRTSKRLLFVGPSVTVEDGFWLNNNEIILVGQFHEYEDSGYKPVMWKIDLRDNSMDYFEYHRAIEGLVPDYLKKVKLQKK